MNFELMNRDKIDEALTAALNDKGVFVINSKERNTPFNSVLFTGETLRWSEDKKNRTTKLIVTSDKEGSGKTLSCLGYALAEVYYYNNSTTIFTVPCSAFSKTLCLTFTDAIDKLNEVAADNIIVSQKTSEQITFSNGSKIIFCTYENINDVLTQESADLIIFNKAQHLTEETYIMSHCCFKLKNDVLLLMSVTSTDISPEAFINKLF